MAGVVHTGISYPGCLKQSFPFVPVGMGTDRAAVGLAPAEVAVLPGWSGDHAFFKLGGAVGPEGDRQLRGERDRADALVRFEGGEPEPSPGSLRAASGVAGAIGWAAGQTKRQGYALRARLSASLRADP